MIFFEQRTNEFVFTRMRSVLDHFLEEIEHSKKAFRNYLTFKDGQGRYLAPIFGDLNQIEKLLRLSHL